MIFFISGYREAVWRIDWPFLALSSSLTVLFNFLQASVSISFSSLFYSWSLLFLRVCYFGLTKLFVVVRGDKILVDLQVLFQDACWDWNDVVVIELSPLYFDSVFLCCVCLVDFFGAKSTLISSVEAWTETQLRSYDCVRNDCVGDWRLWSCILCLNNVY